MIEDDEKMTHDYVSGEFKFTNRTFDVMQHAWHKRTFDYLSTFWTEFYDLNHERLKDVYDFYPKRKPVVFKSVD